MRSMGTPATMEPPATCRIIRTAGTERAWALGKSVLGSAATAMMIRDSTNQASTARRQLRARQSATRCRNETRGVRWRQTMAPIARPPYEAGVRVPRVVIPAWRIMAPPVAGPLEPAPNRRAVRAPVIRAPRLSLPSDVSRYIVLSTWGFPVLATEGTMATEFNVRVGDPDREAVAAQLREHFADGRLTLEELNERLDQAFAAKTRADLNTVMRDLPQAAQPAAGAPFGGVRDTAWPGPAWPGQIPTRPGQDYGHGHGPWGGPQGAQRPRGPFSAFAPLMGLIWFFLILGSVFLFGL